MSNTEDDVQEVDDATRFEAKPDASFNEGEDLDTSDVSDDDIEFLSIDGRAGLMALAKDYHIALRGPNALLLSSDRRVMIVMPREELDLDRMDSGSAPFTVPIEAILAVEEFSSMAYEDEANAHESALTEGQDARLSADLLEQPNHPADT